MTTASTEMEDSSKATSGLSQPLFAQVQFHIVPSPEFQGEPADSLARLLVEHGANQFSRSPTDDKLPLDQITHLISRISDFPDYDAAVSALRAVVKPEWVEASLVRGRLQNPRSYSPDPRHFFSGLVVCCAELPAGDKDAIIGGVCAMGGLHTNAVSKVVTHLVALTLDPEKCQTAIAKNLKCKIVLPHWFDDCTKLGKRINEGPYCLPNPEILRKRPEDRVPERGTPDLKGALSPRAGRLPTPSASPSGSRRQLAVFKNKKVMLSNDLEIGSHLRGTIEELIVGGGGAITGSVHKANMFICQYRDSLEYRIASRAGSDVGNLPWLYHLITYDTWTSPLRRLLHYPIARQGLPGFKEFRICLSNYNGEARVYLENLAKAAGGEFTRAMREDNTHLITAHTVSEKCEAAKEWNINMVNHLWLEESYAKWSIQTISNPRYTHFPSRTNLGEIVGQTPIDKKAIEQVFFPPGSDFDPAAEDGKPTKSVTAAQQPVSKLPTSIAVDLSSSARKSAIPTPKISKTNGREDDGSELKTPLSARFLKGNKENETPPTTGSRSAKERAVAKLHELAPDIALFEKESKRVGGVIFGGRRISADECSNGNGKRSMSKDEETNTEADEESRGAKKAKKSKVPATMRLLLSGYKRWVGLPKKETEDRTRLRDLGILLTEEPGSCTHMAAPSIIRTQKFISAIAHGPIILSTDFVDQCLAENKRLQPEDFILQDVEGEARLGFKLTEATARAKEHNGHLLQGHAVYCTEAINGGFDTYKAIAGANGGKCLLYRTRAGSHPVARASRSDDSLQYLYLLSGDTTDEVKLWPKFRQTAQGNGMIPRIVKSDWMIDVAMSQRIHWQEFYEWKDGAAEMDA